jgi:hypothetical protein
VDAIGHKLFVEILSAHAWYSISDVTSGLWKNLNTLLNQRLDSNARLRGAIINLSTNGIHAAAPEPGGQFVKGLGTIDAAPIDIDLDGGLNPLPDKEFGKAHIKFHTELDDKETEDSVRVLIYRDSELVADFGPVGNDVLWDNWTDQDWNCRETACPQFKTPVRLSDCNNMSVQIIKGPTTKGWKMWFELSGVAGDGSEEMLLFYPQQIEIGEDSPNTFTPKFRC